MKVDAKNAVTKLQAIVIALIIIIAAVAGGYYVLTLPQGTPPLGPATITGKVTDATTGAPISGAVVTLGQLKYNTGSDGTYSFSVKVGNYSLAVAVNGYDTNATSVNAAEEKTYTVNIGLAATPIPQVLTIGTTDRPTTLDPGSLMTSAAAWVDQWVLDTLVRCNPQTLVVEPWLAKNWTISEDGKTIDFNLETGVMFHDGNEFTADDVKFTFDRESHLDGVMNYLIVDNVNATQVIDKYHVRITTYNAMPQVMLKILTCALYGIVPKNNIQQTAGNNSAWGTEAWGYDVFVGTGPYKFVQYVRDQKIIFERNPNYWAQRKGYNPTLQRVTYSMYGDSAALRMALEKKEIDATWRGLDRLDIPTLLSNPNIRVYETPFNLETLDIFPAADPRLNDTRIRQAIAYAIDTEQVLNLGFKNRGVLTESIIPPSETFFYYPAFANYTHDTVKAKQLLAAAGFPDGFTADYYLSSDYVDVATVLQQNLKEVGITLNLHLVDSVELRKMRKAGQVPLQDSYWWPDFPDPENWLTELIQYNIGYAGWNATVINQFNLLGSQAAQEGNNTLRKAIYAQMEDICAQQMWVYPLAYTYKSVAVQSYVQNFSYPYSFYDEIYGFGYCTIGRKS